MTETFGKDVKIGDKFWCKGRDCNEYIRIEEIEYRTLKRKTNYANAVNISNGKLKFIEDEAEVDF